MKHCNHENTQSNRWIASCALSIGPPDPFDYFLILLHFIPFQRYKLHYQQLVWSRINDNFFYKIRRYYLWWNYTQWQQKWGHLYFICYCSIELANLLMVLWLGRTTQKRQKCFVRRMVAILWNSNGMPSKKIYCFNFPVDWSKWYTKIW